MDLRERKQIINGATESLPEYSEGKWLHGVAKKDIPGMVTTGINFAGSAINSFGGVKSAGDILQESGTSVGLGSGFSYLKLNAVDVGAQMDELSKQNTANTLNTAASGASLGSAFGPIGAGIGGVVGGAVGFIGGLFRKNKMAERIRQALIQAVRNNNFNLASAQTDYLTNLYNVEHDNTQDDLIYSAKDGMVPGFDNGKANAKVSNGEFVIDTFTGKTGRMPGKPNKKDSLLVHLDNPDGTAIVSNNKLADGIRNSDYFAMTGDLNGALMRDLIYRDMKDYRTVKLLEYGSFNAKNGMLLAKDGKDMNEALQDAIKTYKPNIIEDIQRRRNFSRSDYFWHGPKLSSFTKLEDGRFLARNPANGDPYTVSQDEADSIVYNNIINDKLYNNDRALRSIVYGWPLKSQDRPKVSKVVYKNGKLPEFKYGKKNILADFNTAMDDASSFADTMREKNTQFKTPWEQATGGINKYWTDSDRLNRITPIKSEESPTPYDSSRWDNWGLLNNIVGALGIARGIGQMIKSGQKVNSPNIYADNDLARQGLAILASRNPDMYARMLEAYDAEARNRYNINRMGGLSSGQRILMTVAGGNALQKNLANIRAIANQEANAYRGELGNATIQVGGQNAARKQAANQYDDDARARSIASSTNFWENGANNAYKAYADTVGRTFNMNKWIEMIGRYDQQYDLDRRRLFV